MIEATNLQKSFGRFGALRGLSFSVPEGGAYALIGANGAGKTTAIKLVMNMIQANGGAITVLGTDSRKLGPSQLACIGYVSENQQLPLHLSVRDYVAYLRPFYPTWDQELEGELLGSFKLPGDRKIGKLSHGMRMKLALAVALAFRPKLLILDEPFTGLDPLVRDELSAGLLRQAGETTIFISSHDLNEIESFITHVGFIERGKLLFQQSLEDLSARVRAVRVVMETTPSIPGVTPASWLDVRAVGAVISFVDTDYAQPKLEENVRALFGEVRYIDVELMNLRSIFTTFARAAQAEEV
jgi:ABC-2 type transport system ATP-binding protein